MADVYAVFGTLLALGIAFPGMLTAFWLLFPRRVALAQTRVTQTPWKSFGMGIGAAVIIAIPITILFLIPFPFSKVMGVVVLLLTLALGGMGAAGIAAAMGVRMAAAGRTGLSEAGAFLRAAVALELAAAFPFIGWFLFIPVCILVSLGAVAFALFGWGPQAATGAVAGDSPEADQTLASEDG